MIIPIILLVAVAVFVVFNGLNTEKEIKTLIEQTKELPEEPKKDTLEKIKSIEEIWNKNKEHFSAITKYDFIYNFSKETSSAKAGVIAEDPGTYLAAKKGMLCILEYIRDVQCLRLDNII
jgi:hypothetical protein